MGRAGSRRISPKAARAVKPLISPVNRSPISIVYSWTARCRAHTPGVRPLDAPISTQRQGPFLYIVRQGPDAMLVLLMVFAISVALALGFTVGRIYQIRRSE